MQLKVVGDNKEKAEVLSFYFSSVFSKKTVCDPPGKSEVQVEGTELQLDIDKQIVMEYLVTLNEFRSPSESLPGNNASI